MNWPALSEAKVPEGCSPCFVCNGMCMEAEGVEDWNGRGAVIRIFSMCDESMDYEKDDIRTEFKLPEDARNEWNEMMEGAEK